MEVEEVNIGGTKIKFFDDYITESESNLSIVNFENILLNAIKLIMKNEVQIMFNIWKFLCFSIYNDII